VASADGVTRLRMLRDDSRGEQKGGSLCDSLSTCIREAAVLGDTGERPKKRGGRINSYCTWTAFWTNTERECWLLSKGWGKRLNPEGGAGRRGGYQKSLHLSVSITDRRIEDSIKVDKREENHQPWRGGGRERRNDNSTRMSILNHFLPSLGLSVGISIA